MSAGSHHHHHSDLTWIGQDRRLARRVGQPLARFLAVESASGILLIVATVVALIWANSAWNGLYDDLLHFPISLEIGSFRFEESFLHFVNDGLMALFFVVGLVASMLAAILGAAMLHRATREAPPSPREDDDSEQGLFDVLHERLESIAESVMAAPDAEPVGAMRSHEAT